MCPEIDQEGHLAIGGDQLIERGGKPNNATGSQDATDDSRYQSRCRHACEENGDWTPKLGSTQHRARSGAGRDCEQEAERQADPPRGDNVPSQRQKRRRRARNEWRVPEVKYSTQMRAVT